MRRPLQLGLCAFPFILSACMTPTTPRMDAQFGKATRVMFAQQVENPEASKNTAVPVGMAAEAMSGLGNYYKSFGPQVQVSAESAPRNSGANARQPDNYGEPVGVNPKTGEVFVDIGGGAVGSTGGTFAPDVGNGYAFPSGGFIPK